MIDPRRPRHDEAGFTLVEVLVALAIMSLAFVAIVGGLGVFFRATSTQRATADLDQRLRTYAESLPYSDACPADYSAAAPSGYSVAVGVEYLVAGSNPADFTGSCPSDVHRLTVTMTRTADGRADALTIVKRKP